jgi:anti-sigma-K factor RskA
MSSFEFENSKRPEDPVLDAMLDAMLGEWLGGEAHRGQGSSKAFDPGEMYRSVLKRSEASVFTAEQHAQAVSNAQRESLAEVLPKGLPEVVSETGQDRSHGAGARPHWRSAAIAASIAASIAVSIGGLSLIGRWVQRDLNKPVGVGQASLDGAPSSGPRVAEPKANASQGVVVVDSQSNTSQSLESQGLPEQGLSTRTDSVIADGGLDPSRREPMQDKLAVGRQTEVNQEQGGAQAPVQGEEMVLALPSARGVSADLEKLGDATVGHGFGWPGKLEKTGTDGRPHRAIVVSSGCDRFGARSDTAR